MTELRKLLEERGIGKAVVIDDVFDDAPRPDELNEDDWSYFFDDLGDDGAALLSGLYKGYEGTLLGDLKASQEFITVLWENRDELPLAASDHLFREYQDMKATERGRLDTLVEKLEALGLACTTMGRDFDANAKEADLIFIDLFLDFHQFDMERAICCASELVANRTQSPPLVVLMSRSPRLQGKRNEFRDKAGLLSSTFRVVSKADLAQDGTLETLLTRLVKHYEDAKRLAGFIHAWDTSLDQARKNFVQVLCHLDLSDLAQIQALLLDFEGQMLGEYLLDVADRALQYEIEAQTDTIAAAQELNRIELDKYPAPHLTGSPDLQDLVHRMIFQHVERLKLSFDGEMPTVHFGDVLQCKDEETGDLTDKVLLVVTPACDLVRPEMENVLVLPGVLTSLEAEDWSYGATMTKTPIFTSPDGSRFWIKWNLKGCYTIPLKTLSNLLHEQKGYERLGRLREMYAIEIQHKMLADMGRIGQPANPPATFPVAISLYVVSSQQTVLSVAVDGLDTAVCFVGRDAAGKRVDHLVLGEAACDALRSLIQSHSPDGVYEKARASLIAMQTDLDFLEKFERGLIRVPQKDGKWQEEKGDGNRVYLHIVRNEGVEEGQTVRGNYRNAPFVMKVSDILSSQEE